MKNLLVIKLLKNLKRIKKKLFFSSSIVFFFFFNTSFLKADLLSPDKSILPTQVVKIQLVALMNNDSEYKTKGIEQTWSFAHTNNKKNTGPLAKFKMMIKGNSYSMLLNHLSHTITEIGKSDKWAQFEVVILDKEKIYHKFSWQVEKYVLDGPLKKCWLTTMVSNPIPLGSSI